MSILIDIPQIAYKTWAIDVKVNGDMDEQERLEIEHKIEQDLKNTLSTYPYSKSHDHVK